MKALPKSQAVLSLFSTAKPLVLAGHRNKFRGHPGNLFWSLRIKLSTMRLGNQAFIPIGTPTKMADDSRSTSVDVSASHQWWLARLTSFIIFSFGVFIGRLAATELLAMIFFGWFFLLLLSFLFGSKPTSTAEPQSDTQVGEDEKKDG